jgi:hypothetical protein
MAANATDHARLADLQAALDALAADRDGLETSWLEAAAELDEA